MATHVACNAAGTGKDSQFGMHQTFLGTSGWTEAQHFRQSEPADLLGVDSSDLAGEPLCVWAVGLAFGLSSLSWV